jgi:imidazolonepropionase-like amidohydrolase
MRFQREVGVRFIVQGGAEGWRVADQLAAAKIPVMIDPLVYGPAGFDQVHARRDNAALLHAAGVVLIIAPSERTHNVRSLRETAGNAVREGLPHQAAMAALTHVPAKAFGVTDRGRIAAGAIADLVLWTGDPLELSSAAHQVWVEGRAVELRSRQTVLFEKYRALPGTPTSPLSVAR